MVDSLQHPSSVIGPLLRVVRRADGQHRRDTCAVDRDPARGGAVSGRERERGEARREADHRVPVDHTAQARPCDICVQCGGHGPNMTALPTGR